MSDGFETRLSRGLVAWTTWIRRYAAVVVVASLLGAGLAVSYTARNLGINADITSLIDEEVPYLRVRRDFERAFPLLRHLLIVVVDADTPERAHEAADRLGDRFAAEPEVFQGVLVPGGGPFFARHALLYLDLDTLEELAEHLADAQPFLAEFSRDPTLPGLFGLLERSVEAMRTGAAHRLDGLDPAPMLDSVSDVLEAAAGGRTESLTWGSLDFGGASLADETRRVVLLSPVLDFGDLQPAKAAVESVRRVVSELGFDADPRLRVRLTGDFALSYDEMGAVKRQAAGAGIASLVLVSLLLTLALRSAWMILAALLTLVVGLSGSLAFATAAVGHLNPISVAFAVLFIGLSVDFGIHLCLRYRELRAEGGDHGEALLSTARGVGGSLVLCAFTTAIGFYAFLPTRFLGVAELGLIAGTGMGISLLASITLLPALLEVAPGPVKRAWARRPTAPRPPPGAGLGARYPRSVRAVAAVAGLAALGLIPRVHFEYNPLRVRDPGTESVRALEDLLAEADTSPWSITVSAPDLETAGDLARRLDALDVVSSTITPADFVPPDQEEKLEIIREIAFFLGPGPVAPGGPRPGVEAQRRALARLRDELARFLGTTRDRPALESSVRRLEAAVTELAERLDASALPGEELARLESGLVDPVRWRLEALHEALRAERVTFDDLPEGLLAHGVGLDGRVRIQVLPEADLNDRVALAAFVDGVRSVAPAATGLPVNYLESARVIIQAFQQALLSAALVIGLLLWILWRRIGDTLVVMTTLALAAALTTGVAAVAGIPFNFADVIVLPLLLGIGVDSSIHLVHRHRGGMASAGDLVRSSTARAVFFSALTTVASFGSLGFTRHQGLATTGQLLAVGVVVMLLCNLLVLPALLSRPRARIP